MLTNAVRRGWAAARLRSLRLVALGGLLSALAGPACTADTTSTGPGVRDVVEFTRVIQPADRDAEQLRSQVSPDGTRAFIVTRRGDVATDRNRYRILLLDVRPEQLATGTAALPRELLTVDARQDESYTDPILRDVQWAGNATLLFRARIDDGAMQVHRLEVGSGKVAPLTFESRPVVSFAASADLTQLVYVVQVANPPMREGSSSVVVSNQSFWSVKFGQRDLRSQQRRYQYVAARAGEPGTARPLGQPFAEGSGFEPGISISPDGRWALLPRYEPERQAAWAKVYPLVADLIKLLGSTQDVDPASYYSRQSSYTVRRMVAYRLADGLERSIVDAPDDAMPGPGQVRPDRIWLDGGRSVLIAGTHLPLSAGSAAPTRSHVIEYWPDLGRWKDVTALDGRLGAARPIAGATVGFVAMDGSRRRSFLRQSDGSWLESTHDLEATDGDSALGRGWTLRVVEGLDEPPDVFAVGPDSARVRLTRLNAGYSAGTWGSMRPYAWTDRAGRHWEGGLMTGVGGQGSRALVIQTYGFSRERFYLDGANAYDGYTSGFAGRAFLREGIQVLALPVHPVDGAASDGRTALAMFADGVRGAIDALVREGRVDRDRVGLMGWSATGEQVLNFVTFSDTPIRAASLLDGDANTLFSLAVTYGATDSIWSRKERFNEGLPFGTTLSRWVAYDPALHTDCIRSALRIETYGPWVLNNWDIYALMRRQYKPAEMVVIPGGAHALARPAERMASLQGNVDWYRFWLLDRERSEPLLAGEDPESLRLQYERWRQMRELKRLDDQRPRCDGTWKN